MSPSSSNIVLLFQGVYSSNLDKIPITVTEVLLGFPKLLKSNVVVISQTETQSVFVQNFLVFFCSLIILSLDLLKSGINQTKVNESKP
jgi:hypothetical protein